MRFSLVRLAIQRPVTMGMLFLVGMVLGVISFTKIPLQLLPSGFTRSRITIRISYPNLAPQEIVDKILEPLEGAMFTIKGIYQIKSIASPNRIRLQLTFREGIDLSMVYGEIQDRIERTRSLLPADLKSKNIRIIKHSTDEIPVAALAIAYPKELMGLDRLINIHIRDKINRIPGVANVEVFGISDYAIFVDLNYQKVKSSGVGVYRLIQELRSASVTIPSGYAYSGGKKLYIRVLSRVNNLQEIRNLAITKHIPLKKMATVKMAMPAPPFLATLEGKPAILVLVYKESDANTVDVCRKIESFAETADIPNHKPHLIFSQGIFIQNSLENLESTALWGGFFAILILLLFLRRLSLTLLIGLAVPTSLVFTLVIMYFVGQSLNIISLMGIMLAIGMLVDNSVVVVESIAREWEQGKPPKEAALRGGNTVALAITTATLTTAVVFLPFFLIESSFRFWLVEMGLPICISLLTSLFVALLFIPLGTILFLRRPPQNMASKGSKITESYLFLLDKTLNHPFEATLIVILISFSFWIPFKWLPRTDRVEGHAS
ncbi:MAG: efflux RND transporter permease subunit, partial [Planctomycetota bacterium]